MWLLDAEEEEIFILVGTMKDLLEYVQEKSIKKFSVQYVPVWALPVESEKAISDLKSFYPELVPLSRSKE